MWVKFTLYLQQTDYMGVLFHFYDSDAEDDDEEEDVSAFTLSKSELEA